MIADHHAAVFREARERYGHTDWFEKGEQQLMQASTMLLSDRGMSVYAPRRKVGFVTWLKSLGCWRTEHEQGIWRYDSNTITGQRRAVRLNSLHGPLHIQWMLGGSWERKRPNPPGRMPPAKNH